MPGRCRWSSTSPRTRACLAGRYAGGVYLHWNFWCNVQDPVQQELCRKAMATAPAETVREYRERDQHYALYRLRVPNVTLDLAQVAVDNPRGFPPPARPLE